MLLNAAIAYSLLDVGSRREAARLARELGLA
jgi:hypothetical protein